ncbi:MAG: His/Gly/Thr/Pro-type tRNA ligase C-terminal domain-containing protein, partial [Zestosphaera sp.]
LLVVLDRAYTEEGGRIVLKLPPRLAPYKLAVFPLVSKEESLKALAKKIYNDAVKAGLTVIYDEDGSIGRRYARVDEIGVPFAVTVDYQSLEDNTVTLRFRDSKEQIRIKSDEVVKWVLSSLSSY